MRAKIISVFLFFVTVTSSAAQEECGRINDLLDASPVRFQSWQEARSTGFVRARLRSDTDRTCVLIFPSGQSAWLLLYEPLGSAWQRYAEIPFPTWYGHLKLLAVEDIAAQRRDALIVEFLGNTGTGNYQRLLAVLYWRSATLAVALLETVDYQMGSACYDRHLTLRYRWVNKGTSRVVLQLHYRFQGVIAYHNTSFTAALVDELAWNPSNQSFYNLERECELAEAGLSLSQRSIALARLAVAGKTMADLCGMNSPMEAVFQSIGE